MKSGIEFSPKALVTPVLWLSGFLLSFFFLPIDNMPQVGGAFVALAALAGWTVYRKPVAMTLTPVTYLVAALWGLALVTALASEVKFIGLLYVIFFGVFPLSALLFSATDEGRQLFPLARSVILGVGINSIYQFYYAPLELKFGGTHWPFADNNSLGAMLAAGSLLFLGDALRGGKSIWVNLVAALILVAAIITTEGRAIMLVFGGMAVVLVGLEGIRRQSGNWKPALLFVLGVFLLLGAMSKSDLSVAHWFGDGEKTVESFVETSADKPNRLSGSRFMIWRSAGEMFERHPFLGSGIGTFYLYYPEVRNPLDDSLGLMAHNDLVQFAVEMGALGPVLALSIIGFVVLRTARVYRNTDDRDARLDVVIPACAFLMICGHSLVNFNFYVLPALMLNGLLLGVWNRAIGRGGTIRILGRSDSKRRGTAVAVSLMMGYGALTLTGSEYFANKAGKALSKEDVTGFATYLGYADILGMGLNGRVYYQAARFAAETNDTERALILLDRTERVNPRISGLYHARSVLLAPKDKAEALQQAEKAVTIDASSIPARMHLANLYEKNGDSRKAYDILKTGMIGMMRSPDPLPFYERVEKMAGEFGDIETLEKVQKEIARKKKK